MFSYTDAHIHTIGDLHAVGGTLECVYPPETHGTHPRGWRAIVFEVCEELYPPPAMKRGSEWTTMYRPLTERALTADEIVHFTILMHSAPCVAIVGSRKFPRLNAVRCFVNRLPDTAIVVSGGAKGVDQMAEQAAIERGLQVDVYPADWERYGKSAGMRRNHDIVRNADVVIAFWDGQSNGTLNSIQLAKRYDKPCRVYRARMTGEREAA